MAVRLSELLDRIRPAGAPGAPTDAEPRRELAASEETARLVRLLERLEADADELIADADRRAEAIRAEGRRAADAIRAERAERIAVTGAAAAEHRERDTAAAVAAIEADTGARVLALRDGVDLDEVADRVVDTIWRSLEEVPS